jgi:CubicO group peptidase (beta-lactamase class C family)
MMSGGLDWQERIPYTDQRNDAVVMNYSGDMYSYVLSRDIKQGEQPGEKFEYNSGLSILLGGVVLDATGMPIDEYAEQTLFRKLGIKQYFWSSNNGQVHTGGGLYLQPRDILKIGQLVLNNGKWNGQQVVSQTWIKESTALHLPINGSNKRVGYGYQWWRGIFKVNQTKYNTIYAAGYGVQFLWIIPKLDLVVLVLHHNPTDIEGNHSIIWKEMERFIIPSFLSDEKTIESEEEN